MWARLLQCPQTSHQTDSCRAATCVDSIYPIINFESRDDHNLQCNSGACGGKSDAVALWAAKRKCKYALLSQSMS